MGKERLILNDYRHVRDVNSVGGLRVHNKELSESFEGSKPAFKAIGRNQNTAV